MILFCKYRIQTKYQLVFNITAATDNIKNMESLPEIIEKSDLFETDEDKLK